MPRHSLFRILEIALPALAILATAPVRPASAAVWQWSLPIESALVEAPQKQPRAFLWIPPQCRRVRAVIVAQQSLQETRLLEAPLLRDACRKLDFAEICIAPALDPVFHFERGAGVQLDAILAALADESGYDELKNAPLVPLGTATSSSFPWNFAAWNPDRALCALSISGQWPYGQGQGAPPWGRRTLSLVPGLVTMGQYEDAWGRAAAGLKQRGQNPFFPLSLLPEPDAGAFDVSDAKTNYLALYLAKAARYRLPPSTAAAPVGNNAPSPRLLPIDPTLRGFLVDRPRPDGADRSPPATAGLYTGNPTEAFWYFDEEMGAATEALVNGASGKKVALIGIMQGQHLLEPAAGGVAQLTFVPEGDGTVFKVSAVFLASVPAGVAPSWTRMPSGTALPPGAPIGHPDGGGPISVTPLRGPVQQLNDDTFAVRFDAMNPAPARGETPAPIWLQASQPGDDEYRRAVLAARLDLPSPGADASPPLDFPAVPDQLTGATGYKLRASSRSGQAIHYYVASGPAEIEDDILTFTDLPPRAKLPLKITVVAWQMGASHPVERSFFLNDVLPVPANQIPAANARAALWRAARKEAAALAAAAVQVPEQPVPETPVVPQNHAG